MIQPLFELSVIGIFCFGFLVAFWLGLKKGQRRPIPLPLSYFGGGLSFTIFLTKYSDGTGVILDPKRKGEMAFVRDIPDNVEVGEYYLIDGNGSLKWVDPLFQS